MIINNVPARHLGGGVILFEQAINVDWEKIVSASKNLVDAERSAMYEETVDPESGRPAYRNRSGYLFDKHGIDKMPKRASSVHQAEDLEARKIFDFFEQARDHYLLRYMYEFPISYKNIWWKVKGHIACYESHSESYLGQHSDTSADYSYGLDHPQDQVATRNTVSCVTYLGSCCHNDLDNSFSGGHHYFNYLDIDYCPKRGSILMFPSNYMATHEVRPVTHGTRYSYLGWYCHGTPNPSVNEDVVDPVKNPDLASKSTNVYMPNLRSDFEKYILSVPGGENSHAHSLVRSMHGINSVD